MKHCGYFQPLSTSLGTFFMGHFFHPHLSSTYMFLGHFFFTLFLGPRQGPQGATSHVPMISRWQHVSSLMVLFVLKNHAMIPLPSPSIAALLRQGPHGGRTTPRTSERKNDAKAPFKTHVKNSATFEIVSPSRLWSQVIQDRVQKKPSF